MSRLLYVTLPPPSGGMTLDTAPRAGDPSGATRLENFRVDGGYCRSRYGYAAFNGAAFDSKPVIELFDLLFADGTGETIRCVRDATQRSAAGAWNTITLDSAWTGRDTDHFWAVVSPFAAETKGRIVLGNGVDPIKTWKGSADTLTAYAGAVPARYGIVGDDNRLILGGTTEGGNPQTQRIRWSIIGLTNGGANDWTDPGSGALDLRDDPWPITGLWKQGGRVYVGKSRAICVLDPTGIATDAYRYETLMTNGEGLFASSSLVQYGNLVAFVSHRGIFAFDGATLTPILGPNHRTFERRFNFTAAVAVTSIVDAQRNRVGWGLPLDNSSLPTEIWWYHLDDSHWEVDPIPHSALAPYSGLNTLTIDTLAGASIDVLGATYSVSTIDALSSSLTNAPTIIFGLANGATYQFDGKAKNDNGTAITATYVSTGLVPIGQELAVAGKPHVITEHDLLVVDSVTLRLLDMGDSYVVNAYIVDDGGALSTPLGQFSVSSSPGTTFASPKILRQFRTCRIPVRSAAQLMLQGGPPSGLWGFIDATIGFDVVGEQRLQEGVPIGIVGIPQ